MDIMSTITKTLNTIHILDKQEIKTKIKHIFDNELRNNQFIKKDTNQSNHFGSEGSYIESVFTKNSDNNNHADFCGVSIHRPDFLLNLNTHAIIVEIDENQHYRKDLYNKEAEDHRLECFKLSLDKLIILIRLNPDNYRISEKLVRGCFAYDENKKLVIRPEEYEIRINRLFVEVDKWINRLSVLEFQELDKITEVFLFYNQ